MVENEIGPDIKTYLDMFESLAIGNHVRLIDSALDNMENLADLAHHFEPVIRQCVLRGHYSSASKLLNRVETNRERVQMYEDFINDQLAFRKSVKKDSTSNIVDES